MFAIVDKISDASAINESNSVLTYTAEIDAAHREFVEDERAVLKLP